MNTYFNEEKKNNITPEIYLEQFVSNGTKIFIDTCSMLEEAFPLFMEHMIPLLEKHNNRIIVPLSVNRELIKHINNPEKPELRAPAIRALQLIDQYRNSYFRILGGESDGIPDNLFLSLYIRFRQSYHMLFITQDKGVLITCLHSSLPVHSGSVNIRQVCSMK